MLATPAVVGKHAKTHLCRGQLTAAYPVGGTTDWSSISSDQSNASGGLGSRKRVGRESGTSKTVGEICRKVSRSSNVALRIPMGRRTTHTAHFTHSLCLYLSVLVARRSAVAALDVELAAGLSLCCWCWPPYMSRTSNSTRFIGPTSPQPVQPPTSFCQRSSSNGSVAPVAMCQPRSVDLHTWGTRSRVLAPGQNLGGCIRTSRASSASPVACLSSSSELSVSPFSGRINLEPQQGES